MDALSQWEVLRKWRGWTEMNKRNDFITLSCDAHVGDYEEFTKIPVAICTSIDEAKRIASEISGDLEWEWLDEGEDDVKPPDGLYAADCNTVLREGEYVLPVTIYRWWINFGNRQFNTIIRLEWSNPYTRYYTEEYAKRNL